MLFFVYDKNHCVTVSHEDAANGHFQRSTDNVVVANSAAALVAFALDPSKLDDTLGNNRYSVIEYRNDLWQQPRFDARYRTILRDLAAEVRYAKKHVAIATIKAALVEHGLNLIPSLDPEAGEVEPGINADEIIATDDIIFLPVRITKE